MDVSRSKPDGRGEKAQWWETFEGRLEPKRSKAGRLRERSTADWSRDKGVGQSGGSEMK